MLEPGGASQTSAALVEMWRNNLRKSQIPPATSRRMATGATLNLIFDGAGLPPTAGMAGLIELTFPCRILACHIYAGDSNLNPIEVTASIDLRIAQQGFWVEGSSPLWAGGAPPSITAATEADVSIVGWTTDLEPGDLIAFRLTSFSGTGATWLTLSLPIRRLDVTQTSTAFITDSQADQIVTTDGDEIVLRS